MCRRVTVVILSVCVSVRYHEICYIPCLCVENNVSQDSLWCYQGFCRMAFTENTLFKSSAVVTATFLTPQRLLDGYEGTATT